MTKVKLTVAIVIVVFLLFSYVFLDYSMLQKAFVVSSDSSVAMTTFKLASTWLSATLKPGEKAIVPTAFVFETLNPELKNSLIDCQTVWNSAGVQLHERASNERLSVLHNWLNQYLKDNPEIKYVVKDWVDQYCRFLFEGNIVLVSILKEVAVLPFTLSTGWSNKIVIYEQTAYSVVLEENFSSKPTPSHTYPSNVTITFDSVGAQISKETEQAGFYLGFPNGLDCSGKSYAVLNTTFYLENSSLTIVFYYDNNNDGMFNGYDSTDYVKSGVFSESEQGYINGKPYLLYQSIPSAPDQVVQIGIIVNGEKNGSIVLHSLTVFTEQT